MKPLFRFSYFITHIFLFCLPIKTLYAQPNYLLTYCYKTGNYNGIGLYKTNLDTVMSVLRSQSSYWGFYNHSSGSFPYTVYGTYLCRGDVTTYECNECIERASKNLLIGCPVQKEAIIWYEECMVRYSNRWIFGVEEDRPSINSKSFYTVSYESFLKETLDDRINSLIIQAYSSSSYFADETILVSFLGEVYNLHSLVQCTPDLLPYDCNSCLRVAYNDTKECCYGRIFALVYTPNCMLSYKVSYFAPPPPPPPPPPSPRYSQPEDDHDSSGSSFPIKINGRLFRRIIAPVVAALVAVLVICLCSLCCCLKKKKKKKKKATTATTTTEEMSTTDGNVCGLS